MQQVMDANWPLAETSPDFRFASAVAEFGLLLRNSEHKGTANFANAIDRARGSLGLDAHGHRTAFVLMAQAAQQIQRRAEPRKGPG